jgi:hypothetical protein
MRDCDNTYKLLLPFTESLWVAPPPLSGFQILSCPEKDLTPTKQPLLILHCPALATTNSLSVSMGFLLHSP